MASTTSPRTFESWTFAALSTTASGTPFRSETRWRLEPGLPRSVGFFPTFSPPFWPPRSPNRARPSTSDLVGLPQPVQQDSVQPAPHTRLLPVAQPPPARRTGPAAHLLGEHLPGYARLEHEDDAGESRPVRHARSAALGLGLLRRQQRFDDLPQLVGHQFFRHVQKRSIRSWAGFAMHSK